MDNQTLIIGILILASGTFAFRFVGFLLGRSLSFSDRVQALLADSATTLLLAVAVIATLFEGQHFAGYARLGGVAVGALLAWRKTPLIVVLLAAAAVTALLRVAGVA
ncbi:Predicted membrane protein [Serratia fonticola]|uniref:AzlD domain-containing protein n=1 Tax=Serratia fonticola TaxID=47917 RepID=UPI002182C362|nr:AzlD domain-containing protein [Serratia fonticola]CAI2098791.1 Predicted membrane protein [Serratia fonticola]